MRKTTTEKVTKVTCPLCNGVFYNDMEKLLINQYYKCDICKEELEMVPIGGKLYIEVREVIDES